LTGILFLFVAYLWHKGGDRNAFVNENKLRSLIVVAVIVKQAWLRHIINPRHQRWSGAG
jgi:hypothetical protein